MQDKYDVIIIGSGPAGAHCAYPLVKGDLKIAMLDGGIISPNQNLEERFTENFEETRSTRNDQYELFLGKELRNIVPEKEKSHVVSMTSGNKEYVIKNIEKTPTIADGVQIIQTLAKGGLSEAWSSACDVFDNDELQQIGIPSNDMHENYQEVIDRIGLAGQCDGLKTMNGIELDSHAKKILETFETKIKKNSHYNLKPSALALVTRKFKNREPINYKDLDFFLNTGNTIYRSRFTIEELENDTNFSYIPNQIVYKIEKAGQERVVFSKNNIDNTEQKYTAKYIILCAGAINTSRILLKSFKLENKKVPFLTKTHFIIPTLRIKSLGLKDDTKKCSLTQLFLIDKRRKNNMARSFSQLISYKSLLLNKLTRYMPLPTPEAITILSLLAPSMVSIDIKFPSTSEDSGYAYLDEKNTIHIHGDEHKKSFYRKELWGIKMLLLKLGLLPLKTVSNPFGSTAHYAGGAPIDNKTSPLSTNSDCCLNQDNNIYIADSATWRALPAKPPALTIMANANRVAKILLRKIQK